MRHSKIARVQRDEARVIASLFGICIQMAELGNKNDCWLVDSVLCVIASGGIRYIFVCAGCQQYLRYRFTLPRVMECLETKPLANKS